MDTQETAEECGGGGLVDCTATHKTADTSGDKSDASNKSDKSAGAFVGVGVTAAGLNIAASDDNAGDANSVRVQATADTSCDKSVAGNKSDESA